MCVPLVCSQACAEMVGVALATVDDPFPASTRMDRITQWAELVQGLAWIREAARGGPLAGGFPGEPAAEALPPLPPQLDNYIVRMQERCIELLCFHMPSSYFERVAKLREATERETARGERGHPSAPWRAGNGRLISYITDLAYELTTHRAAALCYGLCGRDAGTATAAVAKPLIEAACAMVSAVLDRHFDVIFNRNLTLVSMAAVLTAAKWTGMSLKVTAVQRLVVDMFDLNEADLTFPLDKPLSVLKALKKKAAGGGAGDEPDWDSEQAAEEGPPKGFYNTVYVSIMDLYRGEGEGDLEEMFQGKGAALKAAVAAAMAGPGAGNVIVLEYPPGTRRLRIKVEETPEPGQRNGGGGGGVAGSVRGSSWLTGGPPSSPRGAPSELGAGSTRRPPAAKPTGKRALVAVSGALGARKKR